MKEVYADIRLKMYVKNNERSICNHELEDGLELANIVCSEIKEMDHFSDVYDVEVVKVGKTSPLVFNLSEDFLDCE